MSGKVREGGGRLGRRLPEALRRAARRGREAALRAGRRERSLPRRVERLGRRTGRRVLRVGRRSAFRLLRVLNGRRARRAPAADTGTVRILLQHAYGMGGTIRTVLNLAGHLALERDVEIVSVVRTAEKPFFPIPPGVRVRFLDDRTRPRGPVATLLARLPSVLIPRQENVHRAVSLLTDLRTVRFLRSMRTGVVISTRPGFNLITALFAPPGVITVGQEHVGLDMHAPEVARLIKRRYGRLDAFVTLTERDLEHYRRALRPPPRRLLRIPNAVPPLAGDVSGLDQKVVIAIGRFVHAKGFDLLVKAWRPVAEAHPDWVLRVYGRGRAQAERKLRARIEEAGLSGTMLLMGSSPEIGRELSESSINVVSSRYEGFSMTILEAMSKGVPVVGFDCPHGPREIVRDGYNGLLVPPGRPSALAEALCRVIEDRELRAALGAGALRTAAGYDLASIGARWDALLSQLGDDHATGAGRAREHLLDRT
ncbi:glycosyltransferase family 4 protein [Streptosporangium sp. NPDC023615]|uniref:glycosyltransferase family 4 protein n=1 Tax=Streptosporangium sp. NPDC023615 TaxID=3154794 RepID=UPI003434E027